MPGVGCGLLLPLLIAVPHAPYSTSLRPTGVAGMRRSSASIQRLQLGWSAGTLTRKGAVATSVAGNVGAAPPLSWKIGFAIVQTAGPPQQSANPPPKRPQ